MNRKNFYSYKGEIVPPIQNILNLDFGVFKSYEKTVSYITKFGLSGGKVCLSPLIDCFKETRITGE